MNKSKKIKLIILLCSLMMIIILIFIRINHIKEFNQNYSDWKIVSITDVGTFKVPKEWVLTQKDSIIYITDRPVEESGYKIYLIGAKYYLTDKNRFDELYDLLGGINWKSYINSQVFSIGSKIGEEEYSDINGELIIKKFIDYSNSGYGIFLIAWEDLIDDETIINIAKSFRS